MTPVQKAAEKARDFCENHGLRETFLEKDLERALLAFHESCYAEQQPSAGEWTQYTVVELLKNCATYPEIPQRIADAHNAALRQQADRFHKLLDEVGAKNWNL